MVRFQVQAPRVDPRHTVFVVGSVPELGSWDLSKAVRMNNAAFPLWVAEVPLASAHHLPALYKYVVLDTSTTPPTLVLWESGHNRLVDEFTAVDGSGGTADTLVVSDNNLRLESKPWRGAGLAIPVFSLRTRASMGVGEFADLKVLVDCAVASGLQLIQLLPINDTCVVGDWRDTYPYKSISVVALHVQYLRVQAIPGLPADLLARAEAEVARYANSAYVDVDYDAMIGVKLALLRDAYAAIG
jgi:4-alpha-glucanotransferase